MSNIERAQQAIRDAVRAIDEVLPTIPAAESGPMSHKQLLQFRERLKKMLHALEKVESLAQLPYIGGMGQTIVDSWPLDSPLGEAIIKAEQEYQKLLAKEERKYTQSN